MKRPTRFFFLFLSVISVFISSCSPKYTISDLSFPLTSSIANENRFALIIEPYVAIRDKPGSDGITVAHGRRGDVFSVQGNQLLPAEKTQQLWIHIESGWVLSEKISLFSNKAKARTAAKKIN